MYHSIPDYKLLMDYEQNKRTGSTDIESYLHVNKVSAQLQLELIGLDIEIRLKIGDIVKIEDYRMEFPHLIQKIPQVFWEVRNEFLNSYCPIRDRIGKLPIEFGGYLIESEIGRGGMGVVYKATHLRTGQACAMKVLFVKRGLSREARALQRLKHRNICEIVEVGQCRETPFLCTKQIQGRNLKATLRERGFFSQYDAAMIVAKLASGFRSVHENGVVHYDIKTSNIFMDQCGEPIAMDFGLAKIEGVAIEGDEVFGSPCYLAPEMLDRKFGTPGKCSDVYGLGVVLYELLTGHKPFRGDFQQLFDQICSYPPSRPSDFRGREIDSEIETICLNAMSKEVNERTPTMKALQGSLQSWLASKYLKVA